jgi:hypothetical protein
MPKELQYMTSATQIFVSSAGISLDSFSDGLMVYLLLNEDDFVLDVVEGAFILRERVVSA